MPAGKKGSAADGKVQVSLRLTPQEVINLDLCKLLAGFSKREEFLAYAMQYMGTFDGRFSPHVETLGGEVENAIEA